MTSIPAKSSSL